MVWYVVTETFWLLCITPRAPAQGDREIDATMRRYYHSNFSVNQNQTCEIEVSVMLINTEAMSFYYRNLHYEQMSRDQTIFRLFQKIRAATDFENKKWDR